MVVQHYVSFGKTNVHQNSLAKDFLFACVLQLCKCSMILCVGLIIDIHDMLIESRDSFMCAVQWWNVYFCAVLYPFTLCYRSNQDL